MFWRSVFADICKFNICLGTIIVLVKHMIFFVLSRTDRTNCYSLKFSFACTKCYARYEDTTVSTHYSIYTVRDKVTSLTIGIFHQSIRNQISLRIGVYFRNRVSP
jgi:hypothetical protein